MFEESVLRKAESVKSASSVLYNCTAVQKNALLKALNKRLLSETPAILAANTRDLEQAEKAGISKTLLDRLTLNENRIKQMIDGVKDVIKLPDPVGRVFDKIRRPNGLVIEKMRVPLGAVGII